MEEKENVYGETTGTEEVAAAKAEEREEKPQREKASAVLGKFKDVDALARAYESLQAEFTRRSQRLKALERATENFKETSKEGDESATTVEKLRKNAETVKAKQRAFDGFVAELEKASIRAEAPIAEEDGKPVAAEKVAVETVANGEEKTEDALTLGGLGLPVAGSRESAELSSEELFERASRDEGVRLKIIGDYLASVGKSVAPLTRGGVGVPTPPIKAKTVEEAGSMALRWLKSGAKA